ncbi:hypothetical protein GCM10010363_59590 [Streptomyces omiyaensis]|uniref:hypothetical protein n=1 Tax=Streptomyces omiyaensis TaxID=68247 RepID=UPI0016781B5C|nr:hypothetical protein [Streptomyces omiyaensis]GGY70477.1 hypothetical protein GCM10010363_59590 [Streptomyces omiyaensis]
MDRRVAGGLVALCAPLFALAGNVVTAKIDPPPVVWYSLIGVCVLAAAPIAFQVYRDMVPGGTPAPPVPGGAVSPTGVRPGDFVVFDGGRTGDSGSAVGWLVGCGFVGLLFGGMLFVKRSEKIFGPADQPSVFDENPAPVLIGIALYAIGSLIAALAIWRGKWRGSLSVSPSQIVLTSPRNQTVLNRSDFLSVEVQKFFMKGYFLVAKVQPDSPLLTVPPTRSMYDPKRQVMVICRLTPMNAAPHAVRAALAQ